MIDPFVNYNNQRPLAFVQFYQTVVGQVKKSAFRNGIAFVWAPKPQGLLSNNSFSMNKTMNATEFYALDTNRDGILDLSDDSYAPYYPGDEFVDWVGLSMLIHSTGTVNQLAEPGLIERLMTTNGRLNNTNKVDVNSTNFYKTCKAMFIRIRRFRQE